MYCEWPRRDGGRGFRLCGRAPNKINLYVKHTPVKFNIPQEEAVERLVDLIKEYGRWVDPK